MKTICLLAGFVLSIASCEPSGQRSVENDTGDVRDQSTTSFVGTNVRLRPTIEGTSLNCDDPKQRVGTVDVNGDLIDSQNIIAVPKDAHVFSNFLYAAPYSEDGDEMDFEQTLVWGVANKKIAQIPPVVNDIYTVEVVALQDFFDTDGYEPQTVAGVCAIDPCSPNPPMMYPQPGCAGFTIVGLINLEGTWLIQGSMFSKPRTIDFAQTGREITTTPLLADQSQAQLVDNVLRFTPNHYQYVCTFTSRTHCDGNRIDVQTGIVVGWWVGDRQ